MKVVRPKKASSKRGKKKATSPKRRSTTQIRRLAMGANHLLQGPAKGLTAVQAQMMSKPQERSSIMAALLRTIGRIFSKLIFGKSKDGDQEKLSPSIESQTSSGKVGISLIGKPEKLKDWLIAGS